jgi:hypothetical protein
MSLVNGTPLIPLQKQGDWLLIAPACDLTPTWAWSWNAGAPTQQMLGVFLMKKALLTSIAALLLTAGTAHAGTERVCPAKRFADGNWNETEVHECMNRINGTIKPHENGHWVFRDPPPPEFDKPYEGILAIYRMPLADVQKLCSVNTYACSWVKHIPISQIGDRIACYIIISPDDVLAQRGERQGYNDVLRHEIGHCNGWPSDHSNRQAKWEWVEK